MGHGNAFTGVYDSVHRGGLPQCMLGYPPLPGSRPPWDLGPEPPPPGADPPPPPGTRSPLLGADTPPGKNRDTVNERPVRILLECILVQICVLILQRPQQRQGLKENNYGFRVRIHSNTNELLKRLMDVFRFIQVVYESGQLPFPPKLTAMFQDITDAMNSRVSGICARYTPKIDTQHNTKQYLDALWSIVIHDTHISLKHTHTHVHTHEQIHTHTHKNKHTHTDIHHTDITLKHTHYTHTRTQIAPLTYTLHNSNIHTTPHTFFL